MRRSKIDTAIRATTAQSGFLGLLIPSSFASAREVFITNPSSPTPHRATIIRAFQRLAQFRLMTDWAQAKKFFLKLEALMHSCPPTLSTFTVAIPLARGYSTSTEDRSYVGAVKSLDGYQAFVSVILFTRDEVGDSPCEWKSCQWLNRA
jgi:hypothetical protein